MCRLVLMTVSVWQQTANSEKFLQTRGWRLNAYKTHITSRAQKVCARASPANSQGIR